MELRCPGNKLHGLVVEAASGVVEFRCDSKFCGKAPGTVVLHRFDLSTGDVTTRRYSEPNRQFNLAERQVHGTSHEHAPLRSA